jgi:hypothetical protein
MSKQIDNLLKSISRHKRGLRDPQIMHPGRDWLIGIAFALTIFILSAIWSTTVYLKNRNASAQIEFEQQSEAVIYRESMVTEALGRIQDRADTLDALLGQSRGRVVEEVVNLATTTPETTTTTPVLLEEVSTSTDAE